MDQREYDVVVVGSGAAALAGAITAADAGLSAIVLEKTDKWGGTSAYSGGGVWIPDNPFVREHGLDDGFDVALDYLNRVVGRRRAGDLTRAQAGVSAYGLRLHCHASHGGRIGEGRCAPSSLND